MKYLYNFAISLFGIVVNILAIFNHKLALFVKGRKDTFPKLISAISPNEKTIWMHCASLGEFEQGRPLIEVLRRSKPNYKIILSFYSPSGYEVRKDFKGADVVVYLPIDTMSNSRKFIELVHPEIAIFVKYEFWPNILSVLKQKKIKTILVSGIFREDQLFFKSYGGWMRKSLQSFSHFFLQNKSSKDLLASIGISNSTVSGDTRFDRVAKIIEQDNTLPFLEGFVRDKIILVAGSTWPIDESYLVSFINQNLDKNLSYIIAPHNINSKEIQKLKLSLNCKTSVNSEGVPEKDAKVFIIDTIGILTKVYSYADIAYIGGGFDKDGVHNVLEPAVFGIPLVIGPVYEKFEEATKLVALKACLVGQSETDLHSQFTRLIKSETLRNELGATSKAFIKNHTGATEIILDYIEEQLADNS
ncbi:MAG: 3-deoxy-D-manno-octulosonic acid transferase [Flavobacteriales bacterium]|nr:3-deoxy-D-manno-octulosonic acid transferase [Flavobacteriales bacterium]